MNNARGPWTLFLKEVRRFLTVSLQTLLAPAITTLLYLVVFAQAVSGPRTLAFLVPGLAMMALIQNAFANSSSSLVQSKLNGSIVFVLLSPLSPRDVFLAFTGAALVRGLLVAVVILLVSAPFVPLNLASPVWALAFALVGGALLGAMGLLAALWADRFEKLAAIQSFVIVPLSFLSGTFYRTDALASTWRTLSRLNPFFSLVDGFRYGFLGRSEIPPLVSFIFAASALIIVSWSSLILLARGYKLRQ